MPCLASSPRVFVGCHSVWLRGGRGRKTWEGGRVKGVEGGRGGMRWAWLLKGEDRDSFTYMFFLHKSILA